MTTKQHAIASSRRGMSPTGRPRSRPSGGRSLSWGGEPRGELTAGEVLGKRAEAGHETELERCEYVVVPDVVVAGGAFVGVLPVEAVIRPVLKCDSEIGESLADSTGGGVCLEGAGKRRAREKCRRDVLHVLQCHRETLALERVLVAGRVADQDDSFRDREGRTAVLGGKRRARPYGLRVLPTSEGV